MSAAPGAGSVRRKVLLPAVALISAVMLAVLGAVFLVTRRVAEDYQRFVTQGHHAAVRKILDTAMTEVVSSRLLRNREVIAAVQRQVLEELDAYWTTEGAGGMVRRGGEVLLLRGRPEEACDGVACGAGEGVCVCFRGLEVIGGAENDLPAWGWRVSTVTPPLSPLRRTPALLLLIPVVVAGAALLIWGTLFLLRRNLQRPVAALLDGIAAGRPVAPTGVEEVDRIGGAVNAVFEEARRHSKQLQVLHEAAVAVQRLDDPERILKTVAGKGADAIGAREAVIGIFRPSGGPLVLVLGEQECLRRDAEGCRSVMERLRGASLPLVVNDAAEDPAYRTLFSGCCIEMVRVLAVRASSSRGHADAVIVFGDKAGPFDGGDVQLAGALAADAVTVIERFNDEAELKRTLADLARQNERLRELDRMKDGLLRDVSHELKTPVAKQAMQLELLRARLGEGCQERAGKIIDVMEAAVHRQQHVIRNLLDLARLEAGGRAWQVRRVRLDALIGQVLEDYRSSLEESGIDVACALEPLEVLADGDMLWHVFSNLVNNAIKFRPRDRPARIDLGLTAGEGWAEARVRDNGIGLTREQRERVFDRFYQASASAEGSGVGLTICRMIVEQSGGTIGLESPGPELGVTAVVRLPLAPPADA